MSYRIWKISRLLFCAKDYTLKSQTTFTALASQTHKVTTDAAFDKSNTIIITGIHQMIYKFKVKNQEKDAIMMSGNLKG